MKFTAETLDKIPVHFVLCTERTGSSMLSLMLNLHANILSPSEEPFALYFWKKYRNKKKWFKSDILKYVDSFFLLAEKNTDIYFSEKDIFYENLINHIHILNYERIIKLTYLHFIDIKDKNSVTCIVDKQIKYFFHLKKIKKIFPSAKFIVLTRDVRDNIVSKINRKLNWNQNPYFLAALWNDTYSNIEQLKDRDFLIIQYESLIIQTESTLKYICNWLEYDYDPNMLKTEYVYNSLLERKKHLVEPEFLKRLQIFHSGLYQKPNPDKIGQYKHKIDPIIIMNIEKIVGENLRKLGYELNSSTIQKKTMAIIYFDYLAKFYRRYLLLIYYQIPLSFKLIIKRLRKKNPSV